MPSGVLRIGFPSPGQYRLTAETGFLSLTGVSAALTSSHTGVYSLTASVGSYALFGVDSTLTSVPVIPQIRLNGGHYIGLHQLSSGFRDGSTQRTSEDAWIQEIKQESSITGFQMIKYWRYFEGPTAGDYTRAWDLLDHIVAQNVLAGGTPKRWMILPLPVVFAATTSNIFPEYILTAGDYAATSTGYSAAIWNSTVMGHLIALLIAIEDRYGNPASAHYDPYFEATATTETSIGFNTYPSGFNKSSMDAALLTQFKRIATECRAASSIGQVIFGTNYLGTNDQMYELLNTIRTAKFCSGGPDTWGPQWISNGNRAIQGDQLRRGVLWTDGGATTLVDMRDTLANKNEVQNPEIGGYLNNDSASRGPFTCAELFDTANNVNRSQYMVWERNTTYGGTEQKWSTGQLPFIRENALTHTASPYGEPPAITPAGDISLISVGTAAATDNGSISLNFGSTVQTNDVALVIASITTGSNGRSLAASGYPVAASFGGGAQQPLYFLAKNASASEPNALVVPTGTVAGNVVQGAGLLLRNSLPVETFVHAQGNKSTTNANNTNPIITPALTVTHDNCLIVMAVTYQALATDFSTYNPNGDGGWTRRFFATTTLGSDQVLAIYTKQQTTATNVSASSLTITGQSTGFTARATIVALRGAT